MAKKKQISQAERAVGKNKKAPADTGKRTKQRTLPTRVILAIVSFCLAVLFLFVYIIPEGFLFRIVENFMHGMVGRAGFLVLTLELVYIFILMAFSGDRPVKMRAICALAFVVICSCFAHLIHNSGDNFFSIKEFYLGGLDGETGGVIGGSIAYLIRLLFGSVFPYILLSVAGVLVLLASFRITIPSIYRAIKNRPRPDWDDEEEPAPREEPATVVVNHLANQRIRHLKNRRQREEELLAEAEEYARNQQPEDRVGDMMRQIGADVECPVSAAGDGETGFADDVDVPPVFGDTQTKPADMPERPVLDLPVDEPEPEAVVEHKTAKITAEETELAAADVAAEIEESQQNPAPLYIFPPVDLLEAPMRSRSNHSDEMREYSRMLNETLASFKIEAHVSDVTRGPSVTRYDVALEKGVRLNKLTNAADDIALSLGATGVRIAAVPGKVSIVGIEVPNRSVNTVTLREVIDSEKFSNSESKTTFAVGKDIAGQCIVGNIAKLPHLLIAGTTGSGKSVCVNSIIVSLLYKATPDEVKLIMVDPKMVELGRYNDVPHLLIPVVTDPKKAAGSLQWAVVEMMRRYTVMSNAGVRDIESYNSIIGSQETDEKKMPQLVVIIDELADLMFVAAKEVEESICRIAQMGRASGIHLVIATQRPSADVITGLMKANIPSRIAFAVASAMESRIILDTPGAEKLVGRGDMLFAPLGSGKPLRVQGCFVSEAELDAVTDFVKNSGSSVYDEKIMEEIEKKAALTGNKQAAAAAADPEANADETSGDELLPDAVDVILETGQASVSMLQRRLRLGYARAARIVDEMEEKGIVGPYKGSKPREILISKEEWEERKQDISNPQMHMDDFSSEESDSGEDF